MRFLRMLPLIAALASLPAAVAAQSEPEAPRITVTGTGEVSAVPDMATVSLGVSERDDTARAAMDAASGAMRRIMDVLAAAGVAAEDVQTSGLSLNPVYEQRRADLDREPRLLGFEASSLLEVTVRDLDGLGGVLDAVVDAGANTFRGVGFGLQDPLIPQEDARREAVADAMAKAALLAQEAGVRRGAVLSISEGGMMAPRPEFAARAMSDGMPIAPGSLSLSAQVTMEFELLP